MKLDRPLGFFGISSVGLNEIFWETTETFVSNYDHLVKSFKSPFILKRSTLYVECVSNKGATMDKSVRTVDGTNIRMEPREVEIQIEGQATLNTNLGRVY